MLINYEVKFFTRKTRPLLPREVARATSLALPKECMSMAAPPVLHNPDPRPLVDVMTMAGAARVRGERMLMINGRKRTF